MASRAASRMWRRRIASSALDILNFGFRQHLVSEVAAEFRRRSQVNPPPKNVAELYLHRGETQIAHRRPRLELYQYVHVAICSEVFAQHRAKERQSSKMVATTEVANSFRRNRDSQSLSHIRRSDPVEAAAVVGQDLLLLLVADVATVADLVDRARIAVVPVREVGGPHDLILADQLERL